MDIDVDKINPPIVPVQTEIELKERRTVAVAITVGDYAIFAGGMSSSGYEMVTLNTVEILKLKNGKIIQVDADGDEIYKDTEGEEYKKDKIKDGEKVKARTLELQEGNTEFAATTLGDYIIFAGGLNLNDDKRYLKTVDIFKVEDGKIIKVDADGDEIYQDEGQEYKKTKMNGDDEKIEAKTLTLSTARSNLTATTIGKYALFAGGSIDEAQTPFNIVDIFHLTKEGKIETIKKQDVNGNLLSLSENRGRVGAITLGDYAIFVGGYSNFGCSYTVDIFKSEDGQIIKVDAEGDEIESVIEKITDEVMGDTIEFKQTTEYKKGQTNNEGEKIRANHFVLSTSSNQLFATKMGDYAIFSGDSGVVDIFHLQDGRIIKVDADGDEIDAEVEWSDDHYIPYVSQVREYKKDQTDNEGNKISSNNFALSVSRNNFAVTTIKDPSFGECAIFAGGSTRDDNKNTVDIFHLTQEGKIEQVNIDHNSTKLSIAREFLAATSIGEYAIFSGGLDDDGMLPTIDIFRFNKTQLVPFVGLTPETYVTTEIVLDENDEQLAEHQLREWGKISHITAGKDNLIVRYFNEFPTLPLKARITVWRR